MVQLTAGRPSQRSLRQPCRLEEGRLREVVTIRALKRQSTTESDVRIVRRERLGPRELDGRQFVASRPRQLDAPGQANTRLESLGAACSGKVLRRESRVVPKDQAIREMAARASHVAELQEAERQVEIERLRLAHPIVLGQIENRPPVLAHIYKVSSLKSARVFNKETSLPRSRESDRLLGGDERLCEASLVVEFVRRLVGVLGWFGSLLFLCPNLRIEPYGRAVHRALMRARGGWRGC